MSDQVLAFAGAEGYGAVATGGRGGVVLHVTNLNDSGEGSLRWALEQQSGARTVVFDVGGTIHLQSQLLVQNGDLTIAGQTAAGEGITLEGARMRIKADNVIVRGMHFRPGDGAEGQAAGDRDGLMIGTTDFTVDNVIADHNSFSWAIDENVDVQGNVRNITVSNNIVAEGLSNSIHPKGEHSKGILVSNWEGTVGNEDSRITIANNLIADNMARNPEVRAGQDVELVNNYIYDYGLGYSAIALGGGSNGTLLTSIKVVGNVMTPGLSTQSAGKTPISLETMGAGSTVALYDNINTLHATDALGNQLQSSLYAGMKGLAITAAVSTAASSAQLGSGATVRDSSQVAAYVLANAGAVNGSGRDSVDTRIINEASNGTGQIINAVAAVSSSSMAAATGVADTDRDGMPDWFEDLYGFNKLAADNNGDNDHDGFTNIEEYINGLVTGFDLGHARIGARVFGSGGVAISASGTGATEVVNYVSGHGKIDVGAALGGNTSQPLSRTVEIGYANGDSFISVGTGSTKTLVAVVDNAHVLLSDIVAMAGASTTTTTAATGGTSTKAASSLLTPTSAVPTPVVSPTPSTPSLHYINGTSGNDSFAIKSSLDHVVEAVNGGIDQVTSYVASYTLDANVENLALKGTLALNGIGNELANKISGNANANVLDGAAGDDKIYGYEGDDHLYGGAGADWVQGDAGSDVIYGGKGADTLIGGADGDAFCFSVGDSNATALSCEDKINDFGAGDVIFLGTDLVDMSQVASATVAGTRYADAYAAASRLISTSNDKALVHGGKDAWLFWDANHDGRIDSGVMLVGAEARVGDWAVSPSADHPLI